MSFLNQIDGHWNRLSLLQNRGNLEVSDKLTMMLKIGLDVLQMDMGSLSSVVGNCYTIQYCTNQQYVGKRWNLSETFCDLTIHHGGLVDLAQISTDFKQHPAYRAFKVGSYIGIPFAVNGRVYGTLSFIKTEARCQDFTKEDLDFMIFLSQTVTKTLDEIRVS